MAKRGCAALRSRRELGGDRERHTLRFLPSQHFSRGVSKRWEMLFIYLFNQVIIINLVLLKFWIIFPIP
jgi:hypothetical protein